MTEVFYNRLAPYYKYFYRDWGASVQRQAQALDSVIQEFIDKTATSVLDVACGIGTQSIGLAKLGYKVKSSDLSFAEIEYARQEATRQGVQIEFRVADMRQVWDVYQSQFDVVIACDNSVPHLLNDQEILTAFQQFYRCTKSDGCCIITVRDYAQLERKERQKQIHPRSVQQTEDVQIVMFDVWDFNEDCYEITTYVVEDRGEPVAQTQVIRGGKYYCIEIPTLEDLFKASGFREVRTLRDRFFQPLLIAFKDD
ncbi:MAG: class I SAM-dependent methyltransferase [Candidatus Zhuqueibacterota bacterium]